MPSSNVRYPMPLTRLNPWYPGQLGVSGTANETGLRMDCNGTVFYVDPNYPGVVDNRDGTDPNAPFATIAAALSKCVDYNNDVVVVMAADTWQYGEGASRTVDVVESVEVTVHGVRIMGISPSGSLGVTWRPATAGGIACTVSALDVLIEGFLFDGFDGAGAGGDAILAEWNGTTLWGENMTVRNCFFSEDIDIAIQLEFAWNCYISHNMFQQCDAHGIYVDPAGSGAAYLIINDNVFHDCDVAMALNGVDESQIMRNVIFNANAQTPAAATDEGIDTTGGARNTVADNYFSCVLPAAAAGDWDDLNTASASDAWISNHLLNGDSVTNPT